MIQYLLKANVLGSVLLVAFVFCAIGSVTQVQAQQQSTSATPDQALSQGEQQDLKSDLVSMIEDAQSNSSYSEYEMNLRVHFYRQIGINVVENGMTVSDAIDGAIEPTIEYSKRFAEGNASQSNLKKGKTGIVYDIADDARDQLL